MSIPASARAAEGHALPLWPAVERRALGDWELRTDPAPVGRLLKRANSCLAMGDPGTPFEVAVGVVRRFYAERGREALVQVRRGSATETAFASRLWEPVAGGDAHFLWAPLADVRERTGPAGDVVLEEDRPRVLATLSASPAGDAVTVARGRGALDGDWFGVHAFGVDPAYRRRGHARALLAALLDWAGARGARTLWLHVETDNEPALAMYDALGLRHHHTNRYLGFPG